MDKPQRIRDPVHDLIQFGIDAFDVRCWQIVQSRAFQRLRRIKQLGFSDLVYPGATHSRLSHSLGVFFTARKLVDVLRAEIGSAFDQRASQAAVAAALVHDVGHGPFSHAFEAALKNLDIGVRHELWTERIILETEIRDALEGFAPGFSKRVAAVFKAEGPSDIYSSIVTSQFDADRLDYMRRDRFMTGAQQGAIDFTWLVSNLKVRRVKTGQDGVFIKDAETFVLGPKAVMAAEAYIVGLFQLYPTIYFHKTTRGAEKLFTALITGLFHALRDGDPLERTGLPNRHPLVRFARDPNDLDAYLSLDDTVVYGALPLIAGASIKSLACLADRLVRRKLYAAINVTAIVAEYVHKKIPFSGDERQRAEEALKRRDEVRRLEAMIRERARSGELLTTDDQGPVVLEDVADRNPYKRIESDDGALSRIWALGEDQQLTDLAEVSPIVRALQPFHVYRLYCRDESARESTQKLIAEVLK